MTTTRQRSLVIHFSTLAVLTLLVGFPKLVTAAGQPVRTVTLVLDALPGRATPISAAWK